MEVLKRRLDLTNEVTEDYQAVKGQEGILIKIEKNIYVVYKHVANHKERGLEDTKERRDHDGGISKFKQPSVTRKDVSNGKGKEVQKHIKEKISCMVLKIIREAKRRMFIDATLRRKGQKIYT